MGLARLVLALLLFLAAPAWAAGPVVEVAVEADAARLTVAWPAPVTVEKRLVAKGYLLTVDRALPPLAEALAELPQDLGTLNMRGFWALEADIPG